MLFTKVTAILKWPSFVSYTVVTLSLEAKSKYLFHLYRLSLGKGHERIDYYLLNKSFLSDYIITNL